jgi:hypothetical protein
MNLKSQFCLYKKPKRIYIDIKQIYYNLLISIDHRLLRPHKLKLEVLISIDQIENYLICY